MKRASASVVLMLLSAVTSIFLYSAFFLDESTGDPDAIETSFFSKVLNEQREAIIHLPYGYDSTQAYPVMYVLDGASQSTHIANKFEVLATAGLVPPTIVVGISNVNAESRERHLVPPFMLQDHEDSNSKPGEGDQFLNFMEEELFPFIDGRYATSGVRLFSGNSRGGLLVMYSLLYKPDLFQGRFCFSTPFWRQDNILVSKVGDFLKARDTLNTFLYLSAGGAETDNIRNGLSRMDSELKARGTFGLVSQVELTPLASHQTNAGISAAAAIARWGEYFKRRNN